MKKQLVQKSLLEKIFLKQWYESSDHLGISIVYVLVDDVEKQVIYNNIFGVSAFFYEKSKICRADKFRVYPTEKQRILIHKTFGCIRKQSRIP